MERTYHAFGLAIASELALPGVPTTDAEPEVRIRRGAVPDWQGETSIRYGDRYRIRGQECSVRFNALPFASLIQDGNLVQFEADPNQDETTSLHVLGSCIGALLFQRGLVPLHGNSVAMRGGTAMLVGRIGVGKSATTFALLERGYRLLADDISAVSFESPEPQVMPGYPNVKLWRSTLEHFGRDCSQFRRLRAGRDKFHYPVEDSFCADPQRLNAIYILQRGDSPGVRVQALSGLAKLHAIRAHLYKVRFRDAIRNWPPLLGKLCRLADGVKVNIVERPHDGDSIDAVADAIEENFSSTLRI